MFIFRVFRVFRGLSRDDVLRIFQHPLDRAEIWYYEVIFQLTISHQYVFYEA
jgi:hypothetical protein